MLLPAAAPSTGLWVGDVTVNQVNEVSIPINAANIPIAPNPTTTTPTKSPAYLRLILHVNGAGQVRLLKSVAIVDTTQVTRTNIGSVTLTNIPDYSGSGSQSESNIVLLTDPTLFVNYPGIAKRLATASYDFSDLSAVNAVRAITPKAVAAGTAASTAALGTGTSDSAATIQNAVFNAALAAALAAPSTSAVDMVSMTNVVNSIVAATVDQLNRVRAKPTTTSADQAKVRKAASDTALLSVSSQVRTIGAIPANQVPLSGSLSAGNTVRGSFVIGDDHPTNPFRHKFHPDHQYGYEITRNIILTVNPPPTGGSTESGGYGVDRLSGTYQEEIFGLHKPLGTSQNIGLRTAGTFTLNRISYKADLNQ